MSRAFQRIVTYPLGFKRSSLASVSWACPSRTLVAPSAVRTDNISTLSTLHNQTSPLANFSRPSYLRPITSAIRSAPVCLPASGEQYRGFASRKESGVDANSSGSEEEEFVDDNGMTMKDREKIEKWAKNFTKESIPKGLLTLNFVRSSGPGGQNVNKVNTKVDMRFVVDDAVWLPEYVRDRLKSEESNRINKSGEYVLTSDRKRTQMANLDDCLDKLHEVLIKMAELPKLPDAETLDKLERMSWEWNTLWH
ncbi:hypothetical protein BGX21_001010 [Mortierella sp. AD011]|nr:hypothetical protein BGX20_010138 [Mortierella sp. AD010]KAF9385578.1 hypothetical protein BGX21_001010 [Mortierella sp. AD011]